MHYTILLTGLATLAASAPVDNTQMAGDTKYSKYDPYITYTPYGKYSGYPRSMEKEAAARTGMVTITKPNPATMDPTMKRDMTNMPSEEEIRGKKGMAADAWYSTYIPYATYGSYQFKNYAKDVEKVGKEMMEHDMAVDEKMMKDKKME